MGIINVSELKPDMVLAEDLRNSQGRFLLAKGTRLTSKHLRILKIWGVVEVDVEGITQKEVVANNIAQMEPAIIEEAERLIRERFSYTDLQHPCIKELFRLCTFRKAEEMRGISERENREVHDTSGAKVELDPVPENVAIAIDPRELIRNLPSLPSLPTVFMKIDETINRPTSSAIDIASVISKDTSLSARLLKIVNSTLYGFPSKIDTLSRAVAIIGTKPLTTLALGINIINTFKNIPNDLMDMKSFWKHSIASGISARIIAGYKNIQNSERLFVAGLIHDIGRLIFYSSVPIQARNALLRARTMDTMVHEAEKELMGFDHTEIGGLLLKSWKLPVSLENMVRYHHAPRDSNDPMEPSIVHLADLLTNAIGMGSSGERFVPPLDPDAWESMGLSPNILPLAIKQLDRQVEEAIRFLFSDER